MFEKRKNGGFSRRFLFGFATARATTARAATRAGFAIRTANASLSLTLGVIDISNGTAQDKRDYYYYNCIAVHTLAAFLCFSMAISRSFLIISVAITAPKIATMHQPRIGIHICAKPSPEMSVPKKYTTNPTV